MSESASGFLPTPTMTDAKGRTYFYARGDKTKPVISLLGVAKLLPTESATDWKGEYTWETVKRRMQMTRGVRLPEELVRRVGKAITPNPEFWEWMMGWPIGSTGLRPVEMGKFQQWLRMHGAF
jgi:DNA (cytosine-5)-methyltransferase 1